MAKSVSRAIGLVSASGRTCSQLQGPPNEEVCGKQPQPRTAARPNRCKKRRSETSGEELPVLMRTFPGAGVRKAGIERKDLVNPAWKKDSSGRRPGRVHSPRGEMLIRWRLVSKSQ